MKRPTWPSGQAKSTDNAFSSWKDGRPSIFATDTQFRAQAGRFTKSQRVLVQIVLADRHGGTYSKAGPL